MKIENKVFPNERDLYGVDDVELINCRFEGVIDGESALKEASNIKVKKCFFDLRYPFWHNFNLVIYDSELTKNCRAALWYTKNFVINNSKLNGIKALRECSNAIVKDSIIDSPEFGWKCNNIELVNDNITSEYLFFNSNDIRLYYTNFKGKYSFQYVDKLYINNSNLDTKDAFWHSKNVLVENSTIKGEYLAWYSENLTFINCTIIGTQPFCYCTNLKLINCKMIDCDLAFEYSDVNAIIDSDIVSIKNPLSGTIKCNSVGEIILTKDSKHNSSCKILEKQE